MGRRHVNRRSAAGNWSMRHRGLKPTATFTPPLRGSEKRNNDTQVVYHGSKTELPRRYVASHRLCLRGVTDYWVNDRKG